MSVSRPESIDRKVCNKNDITIASLTCYICSGSVTYCWYTRIATNLLSPLLS